MAERYEKLLDAVGWQILRILQENARSSFREIGLRVGLAASSVAERVRHMEETGIISGYHTHVNLAMVGLPIMAFVRMNTAGQKSSRLAERLREIPEVLECYRLTGSESFIMKVGVSSVEHLEKLVDDLSLYGQPTTSIVMSVPLARRIIEQDPLYSNVEDHASPTDEA